MAKFQFYLPKDNDLTRIQRRAIDATTPIFLSGVPGTGKRRWFLFLITALTVTNIGQSLTKMGYFRT